MENTIKSLPMVALRGMTIMPEMVVHFGCCDTRSDGGRTKDFLDCTKIDRHRGS